MTAPTGGPNPIGRAVKALHDRVVAAAEARRVEGDPSTLVRVQYGDPGEFEEPRAVGVALGTVPVEPVDERPRTVSLGYDLHDIDIVCVAVAWTGDEDDAAREQMMFDALDLVDGLVREVLLADPTLGLPEVIRAARVDRSGLGWESPGRGTQCVVEFTVRVSAGRPRRPRRTQ